MPIPAPKPNHTAEDVMWGLVLAAVLLFLMLAPNYCFRVSEEDKKKLREIKMRRKMRAENAEAEPEPRPKVD